VLAGDEKRRSQPLVLIALGERHPVRRWKPNVYGSPTVG
jgi:hypothetical protein